MQIPKETKNWGIKLDLLDSVNNLLMIKMAVTWLHSLGNLIIMIVQPTVTVGWRRGPKLVTMWMGALRQMITSTPGWSTSGKGANDISRRRR